MDLSEWMLHDSNKSLRLSVETDTSYLPFSVAQSKTQGQPVLKSREKDAAS